MTRVQSPLTKRYLEAFELLTLADPKAEELFASLQADYPDDALVNLHYDRITSGILSSTIVLAEK